MKRTAVLLALAVCATACSSDSEPQTAPITAPPSTADSGSPSPTASAPSSSPAVAPSPAKSTAAAGTECVNKNLSVEPGDSQGAAGTIYTRFVVTNKGTTACTLHGHPDVHPYKGTPPSRIAGYKIVRIAADDPHLGATPPATTLAPGTGTAVFFVVYGTASIGDAPCKKATGLLFAAPPRTSWTAAPAVPFEFTSCGSPIKVSAVFPPSKNL